MPAQRRAFLEALPLEDVSRFKFLDETGTHLGYTRCYSCAQSGKHGGQGVSLRQCGNVTVVGARTVNGLEAVMELAGSLNEARCAAYLDQVLDPTLGPSDVVVPVNLRVYKMAGMAERVAVYGTRLLFLPPYSPDFSPVELAWGKPKTALRTVQVRTRQDLSATLTLVYRLRVGYKERCAKPDCPIWLSDLFPNMKSIIFRVVFRVRNGGCSENQRILAWPSKKSFLAT